MLTGSSVFYLRMVPEPPSLCVSSARQLSLRACPLPLALALAQRTAPRIWQIWKTHQCSSGCGWHADDVVAQNRLFCFERDVTLISFEINTNTAMTILFLSFSLCFMAWWEYTSMDFLVAFFAFKGPFSLFFFMKTTLQPKIRTVREPLFLIEFICFVFFLFCLLWLENE